MTHQTPNGFSPDILNMISKRPLEAIPAWFQQITNADRGTIFLFPGDMYWVIKDKVILPCTLLNEVVILYGLRSTPMPNRSFLLNGHIFVASKQIRNWIIYFTV